MLSVEDNERLARVGRGTPMGSLMRRFWIPFMVQHDLPEADGPPVRVALLGESLVAFRDTSGRVGLVERRCAHRPGGPLLRPQRGERAALHLPRLEVRRDRPLRGHAD